MPIVCTSCESSDLEIISNSWYEFFEHCYIAHPTERCYIRQIPFNISGRTKKQIVNMAEISYLKDYLI